MYNMNRKTKLHDVTMFNFTECMAGLAICMFGLKKIKMFK